MDREITQELIEEAASNPDNEIAADLSERTVVYLDQKAWGAIRVDASNGYPNDISFGDLAERSVDEADFVYPFSLENLIETTSAANIDFKSETLKTMMHLSTNYSIRNYLQVLDHEAKNFVCKRYDLLPELDSRSFVFGKGIIHMIGKWEVQSDGDVPEEKMEKVKNQFARVLKDEEVNRRLIQSSLIVEDMPGVSPADRKDYEEGYQEIVQHVDETLALEDHEGRGLYLSDVFIDRMIPRIRQCCVELDLEMLPLFLSDPHKLSFEDFFSQFPAFYTYATLCFAVDAHSERNPDFNDVLDISQLAVAAPYADIVVTEQFFGGMLYRFEINKAFDTTVFTNIDEFGMFLRERLS